MTAQGGQVALDTAWPTEGWTDRGREEVLSWLTDVSILLLNEVEAAGLMARTDLDLDRGYQEILALMPEASLFVTKTGGRGSRRTAHP